MIAIKVCVGSACHLKGSYNIINLFSNLIEKSNMSNKVELKGAFCLGRCTEGVSVNIEGEEEIYSINEENIEKFFKEKILGRIL